MADLICVAFEDPTTADRVLTELTALQKEFVIRLKDACVVVRSPDGEIQLHQAMPLVRTGAVSGGTSGALWGGLIGLLFLNPLAGMTIGAGVGAASGALAGKVSDYGIPDDFIRDLGRTIKPNSSPCSCSWRRSRPTRSCRGCRTSKVACSRRRSRMNGKSDFVKHWAIWG